MPETWYRGESPNLSPSKPGGSLHDLGDGIYLTDSEQVAWKYAKTRAAGEHKDYRVLQLTIDRKSLGRVLDLSKDPGWHKFMSKPMLPGSTNPNLARSRLDYVKGQNELYGQYFREYLQLNKLNINSYDAVIAPEYVRGGNQLCILHKNGQPTKLAARIRALLRPEPWAARLAQSQAASATRGTPMPRPAQAGKPVITLPSARTLVRVGAFITGIGLSFLVNYLLQKVIGAVNQKALEEDMQKLAPEIERYINGNKRLLVDKLASDGSAHFVAKLMIEYVAMFQPSPTGRGGGYGPEIYQRVRLRSVNIFSRALVEPTRIRYGGQLGMRITTHEYDMSGELTLPREEIDAYRDAMAQDKWLMELRKNPNLLDSDREQIKKEYSALTEWINAMFPLLDFKPNRALWTDDGYAGFTGKAA